MKPFFNPFLTKGDHFKKDLLLTYSLGVKFFKNAERNQFVLLKDPFNSNKKIVRYLVGLPGDWVREKNTQIFHRVPEGYIWVESFSGKSDSNEWGPVLYYL